LDYKQPKIITMEIERINLLVQLSGKSQTTLAKHLQITRGCLNNYLKGRRVMDELIKSSICKYFDVPEKILTQHTVYIVLKGNKLTIT